MEIKYVNAEGVSMVFRQSQPFFITKIDGIGNIGNTIQSFKAPDQDGAFFVGSTRDMRTVTIEGTIVAANADEAYTLRRKLLSMLTPKQPGTLVFRDRKIACVVDDVKLIVSTKERLPRFIISFLCPSPYFEALDATRDDLALWQPLFKFPLIIPSIGIEMGTRQPNQIIEVINAGDVPCGCEVVFKALGVVVNPELRNLETNEYIKINKTMMSGEEIHVFTHFANKKVSSIIGGSSTNIFYALDVGSTFLQFGTGTNVLRYDAAEGLDLLEVALEYSACFAGI